MELIPIEIEKAEAYIDEATGMKYFSITINNKVYDFESNNIKKEPVDIVDRLWDAIKQINERIDKLQSQCNCKLQS
jgi:hypothetical protein